MKATLIHWTIRPGEDGYSLLGEFTFNTCPRKGEIVVLGMREYTVIAVKHFANGHTEVHV